MSLNHEKLHVYQKSLDVVTLVDRWLSELKRRPVAADHLRRASTSVPLNIAEGNGDFSQRRRAYFFDIARGSALESAACLDLLRSFSLLDREAVGEGKVQLSQVCAMLYKLRDVDVSQWQIGEEDIPYETEHVQESLFSHERLKVYRVALRTATTVDQALLEHGDGVHVKLGLERSTTGIVLNIAEGNGRFAKKDRVKFLKTAYSHALKTAAMIDVWAHGRSPLGERMIRCIKGDVGQVSAMLVGLMRSVSERPY